MAHPGSQNNQTFISKFFQMESAGGILLVISAVLAIILANTNLNSIYTMLIETPVAVQIGALKIAKPLLLWINDGLMAVFFFLVGLELKREFLEGELKDVKNIILPGLGAVGGMAVPALIYLIFNYNDPVAVKGWAIPAATDIAFALGVLSLLGKRVPISLKVFLTSLAIFDDVGAILIIALFYTSKISMIALYIAAACVVVLAILNRSGVVATSLYLAVGAVMWVAMLKSGVHATLAGVLLAFFIPIRTNDGTGHSPLKEMEHNLHFTVTFIILPIFAFSNSGISFSGMGFDEVFHTVPIGIALGLFIGKQLGVFGFCWVGLKMGLFELPKGMTTGGMYGVAALSGIGFTMSLFIGSLAFEETGVNLLFDERLGIIIGSLGSGILGYLVLNASLKKESNG